MHPTIRDVDLLVGVVFFLLGALLAVVLKLWIAIDDQPREVGALFVFGPGADEPARTAREAREIKQREEHPDAPCGTLTDLLNSDDTGE
jgi:hypothetical protein